MTATALAAGLPDIGISFAARLLRTGTEHYRAGRLADAIAAFQAGLGAIETDDGSPDSAPVETVSDLHAHLGNAWMGLGDLAAATASYKAALRLAPHRTSCWCNLGNALHQAGKPEDAIAYYLEALRFSPGHWPSRTNLVQALIATRQYIIARGLLLELINERPQDGIVRRLLGKVHFELNEPRSAIACFERAVALDPRDSESLYWIGAVRQSLGETETAEVAYAEAAQIQPLIRRPAAKTPADFRVLALYGPFAGNTPAEYLFKDVGYDVDTLSLFASGRYEAEALKDADVVVNLISDADQADGLLPLAADLVHRIARPTINDPRRIGKTTRDGMTNLLAGIPGCIVPGIQRQTAGAVPAPAALRDAVQPSSSVLVRPVGTHGGDDFEKIEDPAALAAFLAQRPDADHYLIEYVDYRSADGHFRKYRFIFVDNLVLPYHLAIGDGWKVHHASTDMVNRPWMQAEEQAFLEDPARVFNPGHYEMLHAIRHRVGLEYFGIDCGLDRSGNLVVFEVNASMLVHERNEDFPYKAPYVHRIKRAFDAMLRRHAIPGGSAISTPNPA